MKRLTTMIAAALFAATLLGCAEEESAGSDGSDGAGSSAGSERLSGCQEAFESAAEVSDMEDTHADLWPAFTSCKTLKEFADASAKFPKVLDGVDPKTYAKNQCQYEAALDGAPLCAHW